MSSRFAFGRDEIHQLLELRIVEYPAVETAYEKLMKGFSSAQAGIETAGRTVSDPLYPIQAAYSRIQENNFITLARLPWIYEFR